MMKRYLIGKEVSWGGGIPRGWSLAWYEPRRRVAVYFPPPLHWMARALRGLRWRLLAACKAIPQERYEAIEMQRGFRERQLLAEEFARGYIEGWQECLEAWSCAMIGEPDECRGREN